MPQEKPLLDYSATSFSAGRMDFAWEELSEEERARAYADWEAGKGLIGGDPRRRPGSDRLPAWGVDQQFFRALALDDPNARNGARLREQLAEARRLEVEIGFGRGDFLLDRVKRFPDTLFVGYETRTKATRLLLKRIERFDLGNVWVSDDDCRFNMPRVLPDQCVDVVHILFPDPWWKDQHRVKRLFSPPFVDLLAAKMRSGGLLHFKSDVGEYGELVSYLVGRHEAFGDNDPTLADAIGPSAPTHREFWCQEHGRPVYAYYFSRR
jgi:tRNA (guanine-N7-)-methyltransferase